MATSRFGGPISVAAIAALIAYGVARGAARPPSDRHPSGIVGASGAGRLTGQRVAYVIQPASARVTARTIDRVVAIPISVGLRIDGEERPIPFTGLTALEGGALGSAFRLQLDGAGVDAAIAFRLDAGTDGLVMELTVEDAPRLGAHDLALQAEIATEGRAPFASGVGDLADTAVGTTSAMVVDVEPHPFGVTSSRGELGFQLHADPGVHVGEPAHVAVSSPVLRAGAGGRASTDMRLVLGADSQRVWRALFALAGRPTAHVAGVVKGARDERARVVGLDADGAPEVRAVAASDGRFELDVPPSVTEWYAALDAAETSAPVNFAPGTPWDLRLDVSPGGELKVRVVDADTGQPITARLVVHGIDGTLDPSFGPDYRASGAGPLMDALRGEVSTPLPAGRYRVAATKGIEWSVDAKVIDVVGGHGTSIELAPRHVVPTPGIVGCDLHVHARPSFDTPVTTEDRVLSLVAAGVDFAVPTEHNVVGDYGPALDALDLTPELAHVHGVEITTYSPRLGHFGLFPYPPGKVPPYRRTTIDAVFNAAHKDAAADRILQVNHPRLPKGIGYFEITGFDPAVKKLPRRMRTDFDSLEVYNGYDLSAPARVDAVLRDWYALLNLGHRYVATGSSDSHRIQYQWAGYPRTMVDVGSGNDVAPIDTARVVAQLKRGHATVTSGPLIELVAAGASPGDDATIDGPSLKAHVRVRAAPWVDVTSLEIVVSGRGERMIPIVSVPTKLGPEPGTLEEAAARTVRFDQDIDVPIPAGGGWLVLVARGTRHLDDVLPFMPVAPMAVTNPIWVHRP